MSVPPWINIRNQPIHLSSYLYVQTKQHSPTGPSWVHVDPWRSNKDNSFQTHLLGKLPALPSGRSKIKAWILVVHRENKPGNLINGSGVSKCTARISFSWQIVLSGPGQVDQSWVVKTGTSSKAPTAAGWFSSSSHSGVASCQMVYCGYGFG